MDQHDQELLEKQLRAINGAPPRAGVIIVTMLIVFLAGLSLGGLLAGSISEGTRMAATDVNACIVDSAVEAARLTAVVLDRWRKALYWDGEVRKARLISAEGS